MPIRSWETLGKVASPHRCYVTECHELEISRRMCGIILGEMKLLAPQLVLPQVIVMPESDVIKASLNVMMGVPSECYTYHTVSFFHNSAYFMVKHYLIL